MKGTKKNKNLVSKSRVMARIAVLHKKQLELFVVIFAVKIKTQLLSCLVFAITHDHALHTIMSISGVIMK